MTSFISKNDYLIRKLLNQHLKNPKFISFHKTNKLHFKTDKIKLNLDSYYMIHYMGSQKYKEQIIFLKNCDMIENCNMENKYNLYNYMYGVEFVSGIHKFIKKTPLLQIETFDVNIENKLK